MTDKIAEFDVTRDLAPMLTIEITGVKKWAMRMWIAGKLFRLGAWIMNVNIKFVDSDTEGT